MFTHKLITSLFKQRIENKKIKPMFLTIFSKSAKILPKYLHYKLRIYNGNTYVSLVITKEMFFHRIGEFISTRQTVIFQESF